MENKIKILLFKNDFEDENFQNLPQNVFLKHDFIYCNNFQNFIFEIKNSKPDLIIFSTNNDITDFIKIVNVPYLILDNGSDEEKIVQFIRNGAFDYVSSKRFEKLDDIIFQSVSKNNFQDSDLLDLINNGSNVILKYNKVDSLKFTFISNNINKITGYESSDFLLENVKYESIIHKDDLEKYKLFLLENNICKSLNYRIIDKFNNVKFVIQSIIFLKKKE